MQIPGPCPQKFWLKNRGSWSPAGASDEGGLQATPRNTCSVTVFPTPEVEEMEPPAPVFLNLAKALSRWIEIS